MNKVIVRPKGKLWECWEDEQVRPTFLEMSHALGYARQRAASGSTAIEIYDAKGEFIVLIPAGDAARILALGGRSDR